MTTPSPHRRRALLISFLLGAFVLAAVPRLPAALSELTTISTYWRIPGNLVMQDIRDTGEHLRVRGVYPETGNKKIDKQFAAFVRNELDRFTASTARARMSSDSEYVIDIQCIPASPSRDLFGAVFDVGTFTGGRMVHRIVTMNFNLTSSTPMTLTEVFKEDSGYLDRLSRFASTQLKAKLGNSAEARLIDRATAPDPKNFSRFVLMPLAMVFYFEPYSISPSIGETVQVEIAYGAINDILLPPLVVLNGGDSNLRGSRNPRPGCIWKKLHCTKLGIEVLVEVCPAREMPRYEEQGNRLVEVDEKGKTLTLIEVYQKQTNEDPDAAAERIAHAKLPEQARQHCVAHEAPEILYDRTKKVYQILTDPLWERDTRRKKPGSLPPCPCGDYANFTGGGMRYFEYHPNETPNRIIFVRYGNGDADFDEQSIKILP